MKSFPHSVVYVRFNGSKRGKEGEHKFLAKKKNSIAAEKKKTVKKKLKSEVYQSEVSDAPGQTMNATFTRLEVSRLFDLTESRLKYWDKTDFISPTGYKGRRRYYTFQDLISIRSAKTLFENGISIQKIRLILKQLKEKLPQTPHPLSKLRIKSDDKSLIVVEDSYEFEANTGQLLMNFSVSSIEKDIVAHLPDYYANKSSHASRTAYEWYLEGCRIDDNEDLLSKAEEAYHKAIHLDPTLANAYTNLGNLRYRAGATQDAKILYAKAIEVNANQPEAYYNLGFLEFENGDFKSAKTSFARAVELDPNFADAHFNLAMTLFRLDDEDLAKVHWRRYLSIEPTGSWADIARLRLKEV